MSFEFPDEVFCGNCCWLINMADGEKKAAISISPDEHEGRWYVHLTWSTHRDHEVQQRLVEGLYQGAVRSLADAMVDEVFGHDPEMTSDWWCTCEPAIIFECDCATGKLHIDSVFSKCVD